MHTDVFHVLVHVGNVHYREACDGDVRMKVPGHPKHWTRDDKQSSDITIKYLDLSDHNTNADRRPCPISYDRHA